VTSAASEGPQLVHLTKSRAPGPARKRPPRRYKPMDEDDVGVHTRSLYAHDVWNRIVCIHTLWNRNHTTVATLFWGFIT